MTPDEQLFRLWQQGDQAALEALVTRYQARLLRHVYELVGDVKTAEDLVQETFVRLIREAASYHYPRPFFPWLYTIARNLAFNHMASAYHRYVELGPELNEALALEPDLDTGMEGWERGRGLPAALALLTFEQREVLSLRFNQELSVKETAALLGVPVGTVKSRTFHALERLRQFLQAGTPDRISEQHDEKPD